MDAKVFDVMGEPWVGPEYSQESSYALSGLASVSWVERKFVVDLARVEDEG